MANFKYESISAEERLLIARDALRGREADHFRWTLPGMYPGEDTVAAGEQAIEELRKLVKALEKEAAKESKAAAKAAADRIDDPAQEES